MSNVHQRPNALPLAEGESAWIAGYYAARREGMNHDARPLPVESAEELRRYARRLERLFALWCRAAFAVTDEESFVEARDGWRALEALVHGWFAADVIYGFARAAWPETPSAWELLREWMQNPAHKAYDRLRASRYRTGPRGKAARRAYDASPEARTLRTARDHASKAGRLRDAVERIERDIRECWSVDRASIPSVRRLHVRALRSYLEHVEGLSEDASHSTAVRLSDRFIDDLREHDGIAQRLDSEADSGDAFSSAQIH